MSRGYAGSHCAPWQKLSHTQTAVNKKTIAGELLQRMTESTV